MKARDQTLHILAHHMIRLAERLGLLEREECKATLLKMLDSEWRTGLIALQIRGSPNKRHIEQQMPSSIGIPPFSPSLPSNHNEMRRNRFTDSSQSDSNYCEFFHQYHASSMESSSISLYYLELVPPLVSRGLHIRSHEYCHTRHLDDQKDKFAWLSPFSNPDFCMPNPHAPLAAGLKESTVHLPDEYLPEFGHVNHDDLNLMGFSNIQSPLLDIQPYGSQANLPVDSSICLACGSLLCLDGICQFCLDQFVEFSASDL